MLTESEEIQLKELKTLSAKLGGDPLLVQGAGGNTSLKSERSIWVKASGTWLSAALSKNIFVELDQNKLGEALKLGDPTELVSYRVGGEALQPSIETTLHVVLPRRVIVHVHSINTIAYAVCRDGAERIASKLAGLDWIWVPYARPGLPLTRMVEQLATESTQVVVLQNHGLIVCADSVTEANRLLQEVERRLFVSGREVDLEHLESLAAIPALQLVSSPDKQVHALAIDPVSFSHLQAGVLYPDQAVFLGPSLLAVRQGEDSRAAYDSYCKQFDFDPVCLILENQGVLIKKNLSAGARVQLLGHALLLSRLPADAMLSPLTESQIGELLNWDAEKYRQSLAR